MYYVLENAIGPSPTTPPPTPIYKLVYFNSILQFYIDINNKPYVIIFEVGEFPHVGKR